MRERCAQKNEVGGPAPRRRPGGRCGAVLALAVVLSGAGSIAAVRGATPLTLDEKLTALLLFVVLPGALIFACGKIFRPLGLGLAVALPFSWLWLSRDSADSSLLWFFPVVAALAIAVAAWLSSINRLTRRTIYAAVVVLGLALFLPSYNRPAQGLRLILIGWDGATWNVIDPLVERGRMPNIKRLQRSGHRARLRSLPSLLSPQIWTTISTGCLPEVHGIMGWTARKSDLPVGRIWDELKREGRSFGLCDWYFTWPPDPGDEKRDFILPTHLAPTSMTFPDGYSFYRVIEDFHKLREEAGVRLGMNVLARAGADAWRHGVRLSTIRRGLSEALEQRWGKRDKLERTWRDRLIYTAIESDVLAELLRTRDPEFVAALFTQIDTVSHTYWKYMQPEGFDEVTEEDIKQYGNVIPDVYAESDRGLDKILEFVPETADVIIVSDHGFTSLGEKIAGKSCRIRTLKVISALGLDGRMFGTNVGTEVYLWALADTRAEKEEILEQAEPELRGARVEGENEPFFLVSRVDQSIHLKIAPRETVPEQSHIILRGEKVRFKRLVRAAGIATESGTHQPDGIYLLAGPSAARSVASDSLNVVDVAPTVAAILGLPVSPLWTGHPAIKGVSLRPASPGDYPPPSGPANEPERVNEGLIKRLRALGYLE